MLKILVLQNREVVVIQISRIKSRSLNKKCQKISDMKWPSRSIVLERFVLLRKEVRELLILKQHNSAEKIVDQKCLLFVALLSDIFSQLNNLKQSSQGLNIMLVVVS